MMTCLMTVVTFDHNCGLNYNCKLSSTCNSNLDKDLATWISNFHFLQALEFPLSTIIEILE